LQIGFSSSDVVLLVMNERGMKRLTQDKFTIGGEATAAWARWVATPPRKPMP